MKRFAILAAMAATPTAAVGNAAFEAACVPAGEVAAILERMFGGPATVAFAGAPGENGFSAVVMERNGGQVLMLLPPDGRVCFVWDNIPVGNPA